MFSPTEDELETRRDTIAARVRRLLVRRGLWHEDDDGGQPAETDDAAPLTDLYETSVAQRAASGRPLPRVGTTLPIEPGTELGARVRVRVGFDLHAGVVVRARRRDRRLEHLCRYLLRPALASERLRNRCTSPVFASPRARATLDGCN